MNGNADFRGRVHARLPGARFLFGILGGLCAAVLAAGCASQPPTLMHRGVDAGVELYFIPPSTWAVREDKRVTVSLDITYRTIPGLPATCNISFYSKDSAPREVEAVAFVTADGTALWQVRDVEVMFREPANNELRVTGTIPLDDLVSLLSGPSRELVLTFTLDGVRYTTDTPPKLFIINKDAFLASIL